MDMSQYLDMFLEESIENLQNLNEGILVLEKNPEDKQTINSIFRAAHTLKGMAGSMGFTNIAELTHKMENVLDKLRNDQLKVTTEVVTILFKCLDTLERMVKNVQEGVEATVDYSDIIQRLSDIESGKAASESNSAPAPEITQENEAEKSEEINFELNEFDKDIIKEAHNTQYNVYKVDVVLYKDCVLKSARAFLVYKSLEEIGEIVKSVPSSEDLEQENFESSFSIMIITKKQADEVEAVIGTISEIQTVQVLEVHEEKQAQVKDEVHSESQKVQETPTVNKEQTIVKETVKKEEKQQKKAHQSVRVDIERLDKLMNLVGELVIHRTRLEQISSNNKLTDLHETLEQVSRITSDLQDLVMKVRMLPVERVFNRFPRLVRDLSQELNKEIELIVKGEDTELDRTVIDELGEPLIHLIRNCADHGIEEYEDRVKAGKNTKGTIKLIAYAEGNKAVIRVDDDGKGLDVEKIKKKAISSGLDVEGLTDIEIKNLIFMQGFSTADKVSDVSGRGVGMDVVRTKITSLGGTIELVSELGKGTSVIIRLPLTLSIIQALLVKIGGETFAISLGLIDEVMNINIDDIRRTNNKEVILYRGNIVPLVRVASKLNLIEEDDKEKFVVIVNIGEKTVGLLVDSLFGQQEIVIKSIGKTLRNLKEYVGATILGDGLVTLIIDVAALI